MKETCCQGTVTRMSGTGDNGSFKLGKVEVTNKVKKPKKDVSQTEICC